MDVWQPPPTCHGGGLERDISEQEMMDGTGANKFDFVLVLMKCSRPCFDPYLEYVLAHSPTPARWQTMKCCLFDYSPIICLSSILLGFHSLCFCIHVFFPFLSWVSWLWRYRGGLRLWEFSACGILVGCLRLYAWEKKLYDEVKAGGSTQKIYKRKCSQLRNKDMRREVNWCSKCKRKLGLIGFRYRCGNMFCSNHRYSDRHECRFDYKAAGRAMIAKENPVVKPARILKV
ncbi:Zinc finger A20 and AN1 domain-containing stress-associated protein 5 [Vitis vinifera]|uniref:Zinc finger A20 and AN1 domain-containing stress-associated protein 5 n=1 Tax=Vitis vinifera TaxID=29760 RepID=A0A438C4Z2_VITVI|nr:Zinc finger A20 and AN1 domain-containing stress-associated protein 5 [Vitis vinifera]